VHPKVHLAKRWAQAMEQNRTMNKRHEPNINLVDSIDFKGHRMRAVFTTIYARPIKETFHEFIIGLLYTDFGEKFNEEQIKLTEEKQHVLLKWNREYIKLIRANAKPENKVEGTKRWGATPNGYVQALLSFAYDYYIAKCLNQVSESLIKRLRNYDQFQGARYELGVIATVARAGFDISLLDSKEKDKKHCEFIGTHKSTGIKVAFEAKSRHRKGVLHQTGAFNIDSDYKADIENLIFKACRQKIEDLPFIIFVDLNLPFKAEDKWFLDIIERFKRLEEPTNKKRDKFNQIFLTNFSYFYDGELETNPKGEFNTIISKIPETKLDTETIIKDITNSLGRYSNVPAEV